MSTKYKLRRSVGVPADVVGAELERINTKHGSLTAEVVLSESKRVSAPLHKAFTWDDTEAGHLYRLHEARTLIRAVHVVEEDGTDGGSAFVRVVSADDEDVCADYRPVASVVRNPDLFQSAVRSLSANVESARAALEDLHKQAIKMGSKKKTPLSKAKKGLDAAAEHLQEAAQ